MVEGLPLVGAFTVVSADNDGGILIREHFHVLVGYQRCFVLGVLKVGQELGLGHYRAVIVCVDVLVGDQRAKGFVVAMDLSQIPGVLERQQSALLSNVISNVISAQKHGRKQCESACGGKAM